MHLTHRSLERRTFLKGMGATVALPFLDAMVPAGRMSAAARETDVTRFVAIEMVHGAAGCNEWGATQHLWAPQEEGSDFDLTPSALSHLDPWREYLTIVSNTDVGGAEAELPREIGGDHFRSSAVFLTQSHPKQTEGSDVFVGASMDQLYAQRFGRIRQFHRCSSASKMLTKQADAHTATPASTPIQSAGRVPQSHFL